MGVTLDEKQRIVYEATKNRMSKELEGEVFNLKAISTDRKGWITLQNKLAKVAHVLLTELNRFQGNYVRFGVDELLKDFQGNEKYYFFDFSFDHAFVRVVFKSNINGYIQYSHIEEVVYEESYSLF